MDKTRGEGWPLSLRCHGEWRRQGPGGQEGEAEGPLALFLVPGSLEGSPVCWRPGDAEKNSMRCTSLCWIYQEASVMQNSAIFIISRFWKKITLLHIFTLGSLCIYESLYISLHNSLSIVSDLCHPVMQLHCFRITGEAWRLRRAWTKARSWEG